MAVKKPTHQIGTPARAAKDDADSGVVADDFDELNSGPAEIDLLAELKEALAKDASKPPVALTVPNRPNMSLVFDPSFDFPTYQAWQKKCEVGKSKDVDYYKLAVIVISNTNVGIKLNGQDVTQDGEPMLVTSPDIQKWLNAPIGGTSTAIRKLYGSDGHAIQAMKMIVEKAGYTLEGDVLEADDSPLDS